MADMADSASASEIESDTDSIKMSVPTRKEELLNRIASLEQENKVLKIELETYKMRCKSLQSENRDLKRASVNIQAQAEQEEEFISNTLLKKIQALKKEKEKLAVNYEQEEEFLTNDLSRKLVQLRQEKHQLERTLEQEQEYQVNKLMRKIERLENDTVSKQKKLEEMVLPSCLYTTSKIPLVSSFYFNLRREKVDLENCLEQEQEALVNRLWKRMDRLEAEKRMLQEKLDEPVSAPASPREIKNGNTTENLSIYVDQLRSEVRKLKGQLMSSQMEHQERMNHLVQEEREIKEENLRLQRKLLLEQERREALSRHLSESESSLEMDDERQFNEMAVHGSLRPRTISSPIPYSPNPNRPISPALHTTFSPSSSPASRSTPFAVGPPSHPSPISPFGTSPPIGPSHLVHMGHPSQSQLQRHRVAVATGSSNSGSHNPEKFIKPSAPTS
ncbi:coiled-coil domain-containing protein 6-like isoform X2 [Asterias rubens]|uniref:coiled-coil domain-containing protein 6-like isoform X2 n=1 Tax=Asterias rubens TaxID=7604 RepID=UPI001454F473|nr:coiled-coil domain-containing protein 6-like isoform X2 [Asterias rubens]